MKKATMFLIFRLGLTDEIVLLVEHLETHHYTWNTFKFSVLEQFCCLQIKQMKLLTSSVAEVVAPNYQKVSVKLIKWLRGAVDAVLSECCVVSLHTLLKTTLKSPVLWSHLQSK
jgi:hypothetical protein